MNSKEKAEELFNKFHKTCNATIAGASTLFRDVARNAAIIAVDEIISNNKDLLTDGVMNEDDCRIDKKFWQSVKEEIQKL